MRSIPFCLLFLGLAAAVGTGLPALAQPPISATESAAQAAAEDARFNAFLGDFRDTALKAGIEASIYDQSMSNIRRNPRVEALNLQQPEFVKPIWNYLDGAVSTDRIREGEELLALHSSMLAGIQRRFGVSGEVLVAIWGIESDYGSAMGSFNVFEALATLGYDGPRADFGRRELLDALKMETQEHLDPAQMISSWAGAFGQTQFVPSAFLQYAVDGDGDGRRDLWHSPADALASSANLLANAGWVRGATWGYEVALPVNFPFENADIDKTKSLAQWNSLGVTLANGARLPRSEAQASLIVPAGARGPAFIVFDNFRAVLKYNNAISYALAVCLLSDRLRGGLPVMASWPRDETPLTRDERSALQLALKKLGYDPGDADGVLGRKARAALRVYQKDHALPPDGFATETLLARMEQEIAAKGG